jgi:hypothetical protein
VRGVILYRLNLFHLNILEYYWSGVPDYFSWNSTSIIIMTFLNYTKPFEIIHMIVLIFLNIVLYLNFHKIRSKDQDRKSIITFYENWKKKKDVPNDSQEINFSMQSCLLLSFIVNLIVTPYIVVMLNLCWNVTNCSLLFPSVL